MYKKKKGVTLLETVVYLALLSIITSIFCLNSTYFENRKKDVEIDNELLIIKEFLIKKQLEAVNTKSEKYIFIGIEKDIIYDEESRKDSINLKALDIIDTRNTNQININSIGEFKGKNGEMYIELKDYKNNEYIFKYKAEQKQIEIKY